MVIEEYYVPVARAGCYVPGGRYPLLSAPIMTIVPAKVAGVDEVIAAIASSHIDALSTRQLAALDSDQIQGLSTEQVQALSTAQVAGLTVAQVASLTTDQVTAMETADVRALTTAQIAGLLGDQVVALNTDASARRLGKGDDRPLNREADRAALIAALASVDVVTWFDEDTPLNLIQTLTPNVLAKGGDYQPETIVGYDWVTQHGGQVAIIPLLDGHSTTGTIAKM